MRVLLYIIVFALLFLAPAERLDVAHLEPVQTVALSVDENIVVLRTDTDNLGSGNDVSNALADLEQNTPGVIYLDTAEYLIVTESAAAYIDDIRQYLHPSVKVSLWDGEGSVKSAAKYLDVRKDLPKLKDLEKIKEK